MYTFIVIVVFAIVFGFAAYFFENNGYDLAGLICTIFMVVVLASCVITGLSCIFEAMTCESDVAAYQQRYDALMVKVNDPLCNNTFNRANTISDIEHWNFDLAKRQWLHNSPWTNWFYPIDYSRFSFIPYTAEEAVDEPVSTETTEEVVPTV